MSESNHTNKLTESITAHSVRPSIITLGYAIPIIVLFVSPLAAPTLLLIIVALLVYGAKLLGEPITWRIKPRLWFWALIAFALWALISALWSPDPLRTATKAGLLALFASASLAALTSPTSIGAGHTNRARSIGIGVAFAVAVVWIAFEVFTNQYSSRQLLELFPDYAARFAKHITWHDGRVTGLSPTNINRRIAVLTLLFWPILLMLWTLAPARWRLWLIGSTGFCLMIVVAASHHQSSQVALAAGVLVFSAALISSHIVRYGLAIAWCLVLISVVPLAKVPINQGWHMAPWLFQSARERVVIWDYIARKTLERPVLGIGADASPTIKRWPDPRQFAKTPHRTIDLQKVRHPHNAYLQVWYESGAIGAVLMALVGLAGLGTVARFNRQHRHRYRMAALYAQVATLMALPAFSYSLWQPWLQATMLMSIIITAIALYLEPADKGNDTSQTL